MKVPDLPDNVRVHPNVWRTIKEIAILDEMKAGRIIQRIVALGLDPLPDNEECNSETVKNLKRKRVFVQRLKCVDILDYRIFYAYKRSGLVCVYCVVPRNDDTYSEDAWHYHIIKILYSKWGECQ